MDYGTRKINPAFTRSPIPRIDTYFLKIVPNIVLPSTPPKGLFPVGLPVQIFKALLPSSIVAN